MAKNTDEEIADLGFTYQMFGRDSEVDFKKYLDGVLATQSALLSGRIGLSAYESTLVPTKDYVKQAEACVVAAELCRRRILRITTESGSEDGTDAKKLRTSRHEFLAEAETLIAKIVAGVTSDGEGFASSVNISSHFSGDN